MSIGFVGVGVLVRPLALWWNMAPPGRRQRAGRMLRGLVAAAAVLMLAACAGLAGIRHKPEINLADIALLDATLLEQRLALTLRVQNPNPVELPITGLAFELEINGQPLARGVSDQAVTVPRYGEALLEVKAVSTLAGLLRQMAALGKRGEGRMNYRLKGRIDAGTLGTLPFDREGQVELPAALRGKPAEKL